MRAPQAGRRCAIRRDGYFKLERLFQCIGNFLRRPLVINQLRIPLLHTVGLGRIPDGPELDALEEHLLICGVCVDRDQETQDYPDAIRAGVIRGRFDL